MTGNQQNLHFDHYHTRILRLLLYYDIFDHLLTREEIITDCSLEGENAPILDELVEKEFVFKLNGFYSVRNEEKLSIKRKRGTENTLKSMSKARQMAKLISRFPFVRAVALSGSISKGYMDSFKDIDYFIITKPNRLWLSRTMLVVYKKIFLLNSFRYFCLNYFIDVDNLEIRDKNIFTATEINTLIPIYGHPLMHSFYNQNKWVKDYYKDFPQSEYNQTPEPTDSFFKRVLEGLLSNFLGNWLDLMAMKSTVKYWTWKYRGKSSFLFKTSFRFRRDEAKYHPGNFQNLILEKFNTNVEDFEKQKKITLTDEN